MSVSRRFALATTVLACLALAAALSVRWDLDPVHPGYGVPVPCVFKGGSKPREAWYLWVRSDALSRDDVVVVNLWAVLVDALVVVALVFVAAYAVRAMWRRSWGDARVALVALVVVATPLVLLVVAFARLPSREARPVRPPAAPKLPAPPPIEEPVPLGYETPPPVACHAVRQAIARGTRLTLRAGPGDRPDLYPRNFEASYLLPQGDLVAASGSRLTISTDVGFAVLERAEPHWRCGDLIADLSCAAAEASTCVLVLRVGARLQRFPVEESREYD